MNIKCLQELSDYLKDNDFYHVAHPTVRARVIAVAPMGSVDVRFEEPVEFELNPYRGADTYWSCSAKLLFSSSEEAVANNDPNWKENRYKKEKEDVQ